jgi:predicted amidohydrolase YtcJ
MSRDLDSTTPSPSLPRSGGRLLGALVGLAALLVATGASAAPSRTIFHNGKIFTADPAKPWAQAIAIQGETIQAVGSNAQILGLAKPKTKIINLHGHTVVPGINDAHVHALVPSGTYLNGPEFIPGPGPTLADVLDLIAEGAATTPPGTMLVVRVIR